MDDLSRANRAAWDVASHKYVEESDALVETVNRSGSLDAVELEMLKPLLATAPAVIHLQSGNGLDDIDLVSRGASHVVGVDFSAVAAQSAQRRALQASTRVSYVVADACATPLAPASADLVYTGKGALMWLVDLDEWAHEIRRLLRPGGSVFLYEAHPAAPLWSWEADVPRLRADVDYFGGTRLNDTFPASAIARFGDDTAPRAVEHQWPLGAIVTAIADAGLHVVHLGEHPRPFWQPAGVAAAAWRGSLPNTFSLVATA